jgi:release factor glutamine methyltransferase
MYEAAEDSELLARIVAQYAHGTVLDVGTGSGILARTAQEKGLVVTAVDIDPAVVRALEHEPFSVVLSDRFSAVPGTYDTIICNPPYLPNDAEVHDAALYGGPKGYEYTVAFLTEAKHHLTPNGQLLFLISSLTKPSVVERTLRNEGYTWSIVAREKLFMEELLVYRATLAVQEPAVLAGKGKRSLVYRVGERAVKVTTSARAAKEAQLLRAVNAVGIGPQYISHTDALLTMQYIAGEPFDGYIARTNDVAVMRELLRQARILDTLGLKKQEFIRPGKNILVTADRNVVLLDFERSMYTDKPNNVTQLAIWLGRRLNTSLRAELEAYKQTYSETAFHAIELALFSDRLSHSHS